MYSKRKDFRVTGPQHTGEIRPLCPALSTLGGDSGSFESSDREFTAEARNQAVREDLSAQPNDCSRSIADRRGEVTKSGSLNEMMTGIWRRKREGLVGKEDVNTVAEVSTQCSNKVIQE